MVICLEQGADCLHTAQLMPLPLTAMSLASVKSRSVLPFWYRLTRVVPEKGPSNGCVCVCVFVPYLCYDTIRYEMLFHFILRALESKHESFSQLNLPHGTDD